MLENIISNRAKANLASIGRGVLGPYMSNQLRNTPPAERTWGMAGEFAAVATSDFQDGRWARKDGKTKIGSWLDLIADKVFVLMCLKALADNGEISQTQYKINFYREVIVTAMRVYGELQGKDTSAQQLGKIKTWVGMGALCLAGSPVADKHPELVREAITLSTVLAVVSGVDYAVDFLGKGKHEEVSYAEIGAANAFDPE